MKNLLARCLKYVCCLLLPAALGACADVSEPPDRDSSPAGREQMTFRFKIKSPDGLKPASRAPGVWEEEAANVAERILDASDMRILIFDDEDYYKHLEAIVKPSALEYDDKGFYHVTASFSCDYFDSFGDNDDVPFTVMIVANMEAVGASYRDYPLQSTTIDRVADTFTMPPAYFPTPGGGIPMYGCKELKINKSRMISPAPDDEGIELNLIRALCKVEVTDDIINSSIAADGMKYPRVTQVDMISWNNRGNVMPRYMFDYVSTLKAANVLSSVSTEAVGGVAADGCFRFYCPEAGVADMRFRVTAVLEPGALPRTYEVSLDDYRSALGNELVRNHIYRFGVRAVNTMTRLDVSVSEWTRVVDEYDLDNTVSMDSDGYLTWTFDEANFAVSEEIYNGRKEQQLSILNASGAYASGTFRILSPRGATWKAYFIPGENGVDAFEFVDIDSNGNVIAGSGSVVAEGAVGEQAVINIRGKGAADAYRHWAELVVEVHTVDGIIMLAPLTRGSSRYIIYRENKM